MNIAFDTSSQGVRITATTDAELKKFGKALQREREDAGIEQEVAAERVGISRVTLSRYENGRQRTPHDIVVKLRNLYSQSLGGPPVAYTRNNEPGGGVREGEPDQWSPNPALRNKIPARAYESAIAYCRRLARAGVPRQNIDEAERLMIDSRYAQANKRNGRELTEDEWILLVDATWEAIRETLSWEGVRV